MLQLENPVSILNQEMSKQFLHSKSESDKYKVKLSLELKHDSWLEMQILMFCVQFFMKATLLEQMKRDYIHIKRTKTVTRQQVERQEEVTVYWLHANVFLTR